MKYKIENYYEEKEISCFKTLKAAKEMGNKILGHKVKWLRGVDELDRVTYLAESTSQPNTGCGLWIIKA